MLKKTGETINDTSNSQLYELPVPYTLGTLASYRYYVDTANLCEQTKTTVVH